MLDDIRETVLAGLSDGLKSVPEKDMRGGNAFLPLYKYRRSGV